MPDVTFLSPWAFAVGLLALVGVGVIVLSERRSRRLCGVLGLVPRPAWSVGIDIGALVGVGLLLGVAAAQPVFSQVRSTAGRTDAEAIVVFDISRSMLAQQGSSAPTRLERARDIAKQIRAGLPEVPVGVSSLTDRLLPHLFPTMSATAFTSTIDRSIEIERPPPERRASRATAFGALADLGRQNFFGARARNRVAFVLTDGESIPFNLGELRARSSRVASRSTSSTSGIKRSASTTHDGARRAIGLAPRAVPCSTGSPGRSAAQCTQSRRWTPR